MKTEFKVNDLVKFVPPIDYKLMQTEIVVNTSDIFMVQKVLKDAYVLSNGNIDLVVSNESQLEIADYQNSDLFNIAMKYGKIFRTNMAYNGNSRCCYNCKYCKILTGYESNGYYCNIDKNMPAKQGANFGTPFGGHKFNDEEFERDVNIWDFWSAIYEVEPHGVCIHCKE